MRRLNIVGRAVARLRFERGWTQELLAARMQCQGANVNRQTLANIEVGRTQVTDEHIIAFQKVFGICLVRLFPEAVQEFDVKLADRERLRAQSKFKR